MEFTQTVKLTSKEINSLSQVLSLMEDIDNMVGYDQALIFSDGHSFTGTTIGDCYDFLSLLCERGGSPMRVEDLKSAPNE